MGPCPQSTPERPLAHIGLAYKVGEEGICLQRTDRYQIMGSSPKSRPSKSLPIGWP